MIVHLEQNSSEKNILDFNILEMTIQEIKRQLTLATVLNHYSIKVDKNGRALCPWHDDKTPSLQVYLNTNSWTCFSSKCNAGSGDQIDMIRLMEKCTEHEAILKAKVMCGHQIISKHSGEAKTNPTTEGKINVSDRVQLLGRSFAFFAAGLKHTAIAKSYLSKRGIEGIEAGFNGGRFHYRGNITEAEHEQWIDLGMMKQRGKGYQSWAKDCIIFPLKNKKDQIVSFYGRSVNDGNPETRHFYLRQRQGLYPCHPKSGVKRLILTESIIDAASLITAGLQDEDGNKINEGRLGLLACYGTNGLTSEHIESLSELPTLQEVIFFFDGDAAGIEAVDKHSKQLAGLHRNLIISKVETPEGEDINSLHLSHESALFQHLIENRTVIQVAEGKGLFSFNGKASAENEQANPMISSRIDTKDSEHIIYETDALRIHVWGGIESSNLARLKVSIHVEIRDGSYKSFRDEVNLYSYAQVKRITRHISESLEISTTYVSQVISQLTKELEDYRQSLTSNRTEEKQAKRVSVSTEDKKVAMKLLKSPRLMRKTLDMIGQAGLVGQQKNGMLLFLLYLTRYFDEPLHAILFGKSGSGKTYTQTVVANCVPDEDIYITTGMTENTLYYSPKGFWKHKVLMIEDLEGVYQAFLPLRELMSKQEISKFTTDKDSRGNNVQVMLKVEGPICVSGATTKEWIYEDNANRSFLLVIGEDKNQEALVMNYQRKKYAGLVDNTSQKVAQEILKNMQRLLRKDLKVINPYAEQLILPDKVFKKLRTNGHYLELIKVITFYNQYNKEVKKDRQSGTDYIETSIEDIRWANRLAKENLLRKSDELSGKLRQFFEIIKEVVRAKPESERSFYAKQIRTLLRMNPMTVNRHLRHLEMRGYIKQIGGNRKTGYEYQVALWNEYEELQKGIDLLDENLEKIAKKATESEQKAEKVKSNSSVTSV